MADIILYHIAHEQSSQKDADHGVYQIEVVGCRRVEVLRQEVFYPVDEHFQYQGSQGCEDTYQKAEYQDESLFLDVFLAPDEETLQQIFSFCLHVPFLLSDDFDDATLVQFNDARRLGLGGFLAAIVHDVIYGRLDFLADFAEVLWRRLSAHVGRG